MRMAAGLVLSQQLSLLFAIVLLAILICWVVLLQLKLKALTGRFDLTLGAVENANVSATLTQYLGTVRQVSRHSDSMRETLDQVTTALPGTVSHVGLIRFNPFHDTGGDQSFSLALLDSRANGVVITCLHHRENSRVYAKPIRAGTSRFNLSDEERRAIASSEFE